MDGFFSTIEVSTSKKLKTYVVRTTDSNILRKSTSGGFITPLAEYIINNGGVVCAATYNNDFGVEHQIISGGVLLYLVQKAPSMCKVT
ncbi:MAG: hypothetical protein LUI87_13760 [Lachnospiraceae bacterium]|nr:hypothetical protein [Lachnospiraceae bacterium]